MAKHTSKQAQAHMDTAAKAHAANVDAKVAGSTRRKGATEKARAKASALPMQAWRVALRTPDGVAWQAVDAPTMRRAAKAGRAAARAAGVAVQAVCGVLQASMFPSNA